MKKVISFCLGIVIVFLAILISGCQMNEIDPVEIEWNTKLISMRNTPSDIPEDIARSLNGNGIGFGGVNKLPAVRIDSVSQLNKLKSYFSAEYYSRTTATNPDPFTEGTQNYNFIYFLDKSIILIPLCSGGMEEFRGVDIRFDGKNFSAFIDTSNRGFGYAVIRYYMCIIEIPKEVARTCKYYDIFEIISDKSNNNDYIYEPEVVPGRSYNIKNWDLPSVSDKYAETQKGEYNIPIYKCNTYESYRHILKLMGAENYYSFLYNREFFIENALIYGFFNTSAGYTFDVGNPTFDNGEFRAKVIQTSPEGEIHADTVSHWIVIIPVLQQDITDIESFAVILEKLK